VEIPQSGLAFPALEIADQTASANPVTQCHHGVFGGTKSMQDYQDAYRNLSVPALAREVLLGSSDDGINAAIECCDRWAEGGGVAINWISQDFAEETVTFAELRDQSSRFR
jgi:hypothetical protein